MIAFYTFVCAFFPDYLCIKLENVNNSSRHFANLEIDKLINALSIPVYRSFPKNSMLQFR